MTTTTAPSAVPSRADADGVGPHGPDAVWALTVYVVLLVAVPSGAVITALGSLGRPATLWGLACAVWWAWARLQGVGPRMRLGAGGTAVVVLTVTVLVTYAAAQFRGIPGAEQSPADSALVRLASWVGVALLAAEGITTRVRLHALTTRVALLGAGVAALGLLQFVTGHPIVSVVEIPGMGVDPEISAVQVRSGLTRAAGTAAHPLEYATVLAAAFPLALALAFVSRRGAVTRWLLPATIATAAVVAVSRSAILGLAVGAALLIPTWPRRARAGALAAAGALLLAVFLLAPGVLGTVRGLFLGIDEDPSTVSRTNAYDAAADVAAHHPLVGRGFGTFLPEYWIFDNQYLQLLIEVGVVGLLAFATLVGTAAVSAYRAHRAASGVPDQQVCAALGASVVAVAVLFAFFDALSFPMAAGMLFLLAGMAGAAVRLTAGSSAPRSAGASRPAATARPVPASRLEPVPRPVPDGDARPPLPARRPADPHPRAGSRRRSTRRRVVVVVLLVCLAAAAAVAALTPTARAGASAAPARREVTQPAPPATVTASATPRGPAAPARGPGRASASSPAGP